MSHALSSLGGLFKQGGSGLGVFGNIFAAQAAKQQAEATPPPPTPAVMSPPDMQSAAANIDADEQARADAQLKKKGRASTILTGDQGAGTPKTATKVLTGE